MDFSDETLCISRTMPGPTRHVTRLLFWHNRSMEAMDLPAPSQDMNMLIGTKWESGSETWMTPHHPYPTPHHTTPPPPHRHPHPTPTPTPSTVPQYCGVLSSKRVLQFTPDGWGPWWRACHAVCGFFSPPEGVTQGISGVVTWLLACLTESQNIWSYVYDIWFSFTRPLFECVVSPLWSCLNTLLCYVTSCKAS